MKVPTRGWARLPLQRSAACFKEHALQSLAPPPHTHSISSRRVRLERSSTPHVMLTFERPATRSGSSRAPFAPIAASVCSCYENYYRRAEHLSHMLQQGWPGTSGTRPVIPIALGPNFRGVLHVRTCLPWRSLITRYRTEAGRTSCYRGCPSASRGTAGTQGT